ncbi:hypothetical protein D3C76_1221070 [compost metagenome]
MAVLVEAEQALFPDQGLQQARIGGEHLDVDRIVRAHLLDEAVGLRVQAAGIQAEHPDVLVQLPGHVHQHHVLGAAEGNPEIIAEVLEGELEDVLRGFLGIGRGGFRDVERMAHQAKFPSCMHARRYVAGMVTNRRLCP